MSGKRIGYVRVSTFEQNPDRQLVDVVVDKKFTDYASAKSTNRPQLKAMIEFVREDDVIFVHSMDRLARNLTDLRNLVNHFITNKIQVVFIKENLKFNGEESAMSNLLLSLMGAFAEFEYAFIKERQKEGIKEAKKQGKFKGSKKKLDAPKLEILREKLKTRDSKSKIARDLGISRFTLYRYLEKITPLKEEVVNG